MNIAKVSWKVWKGNRHVTESAFFKNKSAAEKFVAQMDNDSDEVEVTEGLSVHDVV